MISESIIHAIESMLGVKLQRYNRFNGISKKFSSSKELFLRCKLFYFFGQLDTNLSMKTKKKNSSSIIYLLKNKPIIFYMVEHFIPLIITNTSLFIKRRDRLNSVASIPPARIETLK